MFHASKRIFTVGAVVMIAASCTTTTSDEASSTEPAIEVLPVDETSDLGEKPQVEIPESEPPTVLQIEDVREGTGREALPGEGLTVHYVGVAWSTGTQFDSSWDRDTPFQLLLGAGQVISGWDLGLEGMKVGGQRRITIPPELGYGDRGVDGVIPPNETLVFVVDLLSVE